MYNISHIVKTTNISESAVRGWLHTATQLGICHYNSKECKQKQYDSIKKPVICVELNRIFSSLAEAGKFIGQKDGTNISKCCRDITKTAGGYHWQLK